MILWNKRQRQFRLGEELSLNKVTFSNILICLPVVVMQK